MYVYILWKKPKDGSLSPPPQPLKLAFPDLPVDLNLNIQVLYLCWRVL